MQWLIAIAVCLGVSDMCNLAHLEYDCQAPYQDLVGQKTLLHLLKRLWLGRWYLEHYQGCWWERLEGVNHNFVSFQPGVLIPERNSLFWPFAFEQDIGQLYWWPCLHAFLTRFPKGQGNGGPCKDIWPKKVALYGIKRRGCELWRRNYVMICNRYKILVIEDCFCRYMDTL